MLVLATGCGPSESSQVESTQSTDTTSEQQRSAETLDRRTRTYIVQMNRCRRSIIALVGVMLATPSDEIELARKGIPARNVCRRTRNALDSVETAGFASEANAVRLGLDRLIVGLAALLNYLDTKRPTTFVQAERKTLNGAAVTTRGLRQINRTREAAGLEMIPLAGTQ